VSFDRGLVYLNGSVEVHEIHFPSFRYPAGKTIDHGVILKVVTTNICGSDRHMVRGRRTAPAGMVLGHEITGEVIEKGRDGIMNQERLAPSRDSQARLTGQPLSRRLRTTTNCRRQRVVADQQQRVFRGT
jgi:hypothetical protein